jgi:DNA-binding response OmpR family regulator
MAIAHAILVNKDPVAANALRQILARFEVESARVNDAPEALQLLQERPTDLVFVDFSDAAMAASLLQALTAANANSTLLLVALVDDDTQRPMALELGAHFVLYRPASEGAVRSLMTAISSLMNRDRRRAARVPIQLPVSLAWQDSPEVEGIILDLSADGMDVLAAESPASFTELSFAFYLADSTEAIRGRGTVAWARANGEAGVRFETLADADRDALTAWLRSTASGKSDGSAAPAIPGKLTDLSLGGCYVETGSPLPPATRLELCLKAGTREAHAEGLVRILHPAHGMGIEFASETEAQKQAVEEFLQFLISAPDSAPELSVVPRELLPREQAFAGLSDDSEIDPLLYLLRHEEGRSQVDFLAELASQRGQNEPKTASSANA